MGVIGGVVLLEVVGDDASVGGFDGAVGGDLGMVD